MNYPNFDGVREFILVGRLQSFTAAARELGLTDSAVGKSVSRLEKRLAVQLLHRTTRKLTLTTEGTAYLVSCVRVWEDIRATELHLSTVLPEPRGRLRIDMPVVFGRRFVMPLLASIAQQHPLLDMHVSFGDRIVDLVGEGIDVAVRIGQLDDDADVIAQRMGHQSLVICASPDYLRTHPPIVNKIDLLKHDCIIGWSKTTHPTWQLKGIDGKFELQAIRVRHEFGDGEMVLKATLDGCGLCQLGSWAVEEHLQMGSLSTVLPEHAGALMPIQVVRPRSRYIQPKVRILIEALLQLSVTHPELRVSSDNLTY